MKDLTEVVAALQGDSSLATCDCGGKAQSEISKVSGKDQIVYVCQACGRAWMKT